MIEKVKAFWNSRDTATKLAITIVVIITSPFWIIPAGLVCVVLLVYSLLEMAMMPDEWEP